MNLRGKKVTVVGLARSGLAASQLLAEKGARLSITDALDNSWVRENVLSLDKKNIEEIEIGRHTEDLIKGRDLVVASPGVAENSLPITWARKIGIPVISEVELAFIFCPCPIIAITGTNGKTTVATLVGQIFRNAQRKCVVCGNIGTPFAGEVSRLTKGHLVVLEISSFQLETIDKFRPKVAAVLNLTIDHLDRYAGLEEYFQAKSRIFLNQNQEDWALLNDEDPYKSAFAEKTKAQVLYFSKNSAKHADGFNSNYLAAVMLSSLFGIAEDLAVHTCRQFKGIEHRLEEVAQINGVKFINDSKATNVDSTLWALNTVKEPIVLIAGGKDKGSDYTLAKEKIKEKVRAIVLLGQAKEKIKAAYQGLVLLKEVPDLAQAVRQAFALARTGDCVLLSPMCASFDMFTDYTQRGRVFKQAVQNLVQS